MTTRAREDKCFECGSELRGPYCPQCNPYIEQVNDMVTEKSEQYIAERKAHDVTRAALAEARVRISALIAECETAKADLAEGVKLLRPFVEGATKSLAGGWWPIVIGADELPFAHVSTASAFIAKHTPPQPVPVGTRELITGEVGREFPVGEEKGETK